MLLEYVTGAMGTVPSGFTVPVAFMGCNSRGAVCVCVFYFDSWAISLTTEFTGSTLVVVCCVCSGNSD